MGKRPRRERTGGEMTGVGKTRGKRPREKTGGKDKGEKTEGKDRGGKYRSRSKRLHVCSPASVKHVRYFLIRKKHKIR